MAHQPRGLLKIMISSCMAFPPVEFPAAPGAASPLLASIRL
jgi:hypothetical protein